MSNKIIPNTEKFRELILLICQRSADDEGFGAIKLNKLLFYCDFWAYAKFGQPITGQDYQKLRLGPAPRRLLPIQNQLKEEHALQVVPRKFHGQTQIRCVAMRDPDLSVFESYEINLIDEVISAFRDHDGSTISAQSHEFLGWQLAEENESIPYEVALVAARAP